MGGIGAVFCLPLGIPHSMLVAFDSLQVDTDIKPGYEHPLLMSNAHRVRKVLHLKPTHHVD